jgi:adenosylmethionine-8-amino-7-oxononanoate aminotransferase
LLVESGAVRQIRGLGLMIGLELPGRLSPLQACTEAEAAQVRSRCQEEGLLVYHFDGGISLFPPLTITDDEIEDMLGMLQSVFEASYA